HGAPRRTRRSCRHIAPSFLAARTVPVTVASATVPNTYSVESAVRTARPTLCRCQHHHRSGLGLFVNAQCQHATIRVENTVCAVDAGGVDPLTVLYRAGELDVDVPAGERHVHRRIQVESQPRLRIEL